MIADIADTGSLVFRAAAEAGNSVSVARVGAGVVGTATADASGAWALTYGGPALDPGSHSFTATATDLAGNTGPASAASTVDTPSPRLQSPQSRKTQALR